MRSILLFICLFIINKAAIGQANYDASLIPKNLLPYASAVVRNKEEVTEIKSLDNTIYHVKEAITVLNKNGDDLAHISIWYNKTFAIKMIKGVVYDDQGKQTGKFSEKDFEDVAAADGFSLFNDDRVKHYIPSVINYPYTIEYEYEVRSKQSLILRDWVPNSQIGMAVEKSSYTLICKPDFNIRYKETNLPIKAAIANNAAGLKTYCWQISNLKAVKDEPFSPNVDSYATSVKIAPEKFIYEGFTGSFTNWKELGGWIYDKLLVNRDQLSAETIATIKNLTKDIADPQQKARKIYEYVQKRTHYISVQIGIGGFQPFPADEVDRINYGDCKALVNYTHALLKVAGVESYYCVVKSGDNKISMIPDFASMAQGDHIILCLPFKNDTTWLECTNQKIPFGFLGDFTDDRTVLACTPQGGKLIHTPKYSATTNAQVRKASLTINEAGELSGDMETLFKGTLYDSREQLIDGSQKEVFKELTRVYPINNFEVEKFTYKQIKDILPTTTETIKFTAPEYASNSSNKLYFLINPTDRVYVPREVRNRLNNIYINEGYTTEDEISYTIPQGYRLEKIPLNVNINTVFGSYIATMQLNGRTLIYKRKMQVIDGNYSKDIYPDLVNFYQHIADADNYSVSLIKGN